MRWVLINARLGSPSFPPCKRQKDRPRKEATTGPPNPLEEPQTRNPPLIPWPSTDSTDPRSRNFLGVPQRFKGDCCCCLKVPRFFTLRPALKEKKSIWLTNLSYSLTLLSEGRFLWRVTLNVWNTLQSTWRLPQPLIWEPHPTTKSIWSRRKRA